MAERTGRAIFDGEAAIVTGAAEGIGRAIAAKLAGEGAAVLLNDLDAAAAERAAAEIQANGGRCEPMGGDASDLDAVRGRVAMPEDIAKAVAFLLSKASEQMRGQTLLVDGGWSIRGSMS